MIFLTVLTIARLFIFNIKLYLIPTSSRIVQVTLCVEYTTGYPDELPTLSLEHDDSDERLEEADSEIILEGLRKVVRGYLDRLLARNCHVSF